MDVETVRDVQLTNYEIDPEERDTTNDKRPIDE